MGIIYGDWEFADAAPPPPPTTSAWLPLPSLPPIWSSTSTKWNDVPTSTHHSDGPTSSPTTATVSPTSSIDFSTGPASGLAEPTGIVNAPPGALNVIDDMNQAYIEIGDMMLVAHNG